MLHVLYIIIVTILLTLTRPINALCECGYSINSTSSPAYALYTEILESDFTRLDHIKSNTDWRRQEYIVPNNASHGPYGQNISIYNVIDNPLKNPNMGRKHCTDSVNGGPAGLVLVVRAEPLVGPGLRLIGGAEIDSARTDMKYGSYRAGIRFNGVNGTCGAFFWYYNDTQEIDMEFLSRELEDSSAVINLVLQSQLSLQNGNDASRTPTFKIFPLPFRPDEDVHEYRFDFSNDKISFYIDGAWTYDMNEPEYIPTEAGGLILKHWSNGNPQWSGGPPKEDAIMSVMYAKAYFNSSSSGKSLAFDARCDMARNKTACLIPDQIGPPGYACQEGRNQTFFFSDDPQMIPGQTVYRNEAGSSDKYSGLSWSHVIVPVVTWMLKRIMDQPRFVWSMEVM